MTNTCAMFLLFNQLVDLFTNSRFSNLLWSFEFSIASIFTVQKSSIFTRNSSNSSELLQNILWWATKNWAWIFSRVWISINHDHRRYNWQKEKIAVEDKYNYLSTSDYMSRHVLFSCQNSQLQEFAICRLIFLNLRQATIESRSSQISTRKKSEESY